MLAAPITGIYGAALSLHCTTSDRPIPKNSLAKKKVVRHCEFSEKFGILEKHVSNDATENAWFLSHLIYLPENGPYLTFAKWANFNSSRLTLTQV
jgi:hypothetical protein